MYLDAAAHKRVLFIGETIIDIYHYGKTLGMPRKAPVIAMQYLHSETFQGGIVAAARHAETFCETVHIASARRITKERFIEESHNRKLFEVYAANEILERPTLASLESYDAVVVADYGHGMADDSLIDQLCNEARFLAVNVQTNAGNYGFNLATKWPRADYLCMDEVEARLATQNRDGAIEGSVEELSGIAPRVAVTLAAHGAIGIDEHGIVRSPAFLDNVIDTMGAGDAFFAITSCLAEQTAMRDLLTIGNAAAKLKAMTIGHRKPVSKNELRAYLASQGC